MKKKDLAHPYKKKSVWQDKKLNFFLNKKRELIFLSLIGKRFAWPTHHVFALTKQLSVAEHVYTNG